jgi:hypothetical protein
MNLLGKIIWVIRGRSSLGVLGWAWANFEGELVFHLAAAPFDSAKIPNESLSSALELSRKRPLSGALKAREMARCEGKTDTYSAPRCFQPPKSAIFRIGIFKLVSITPLSSNGGFSTLLT